MAFWAEFLESDNLYIYMIKQFLIRMFNSFHWALDVTAFLY